MRYQNNTKPPGPIQQNAKNLRKAQTPPESVLWQQLRSRRLGGFKFRRQFPIGRFITDFYCHEVLLIVELDGSSHEDQVEYDSERSHWLVENGYHVIRFSNQQVVKELEGVCRKILFECEPRVKQKSPSPQPSPEGEGARSSPEFAVDG